MEYDLHRCWFVFSRNPEIFKSRMIRYVGHVHIRQNEEFTQQVGSEISE